jgi:8-oxo-(d)GTP phosphatase
MTAVSEKAGHMIRAAGGVLWRAPGCGAVEVALVHRPRYGDWSLPKGKLRPGEHPLVTACREVAEETGIRAVAGRRLDIGHYGTAAGPKAVEYWAMQGPDTAFTPTREVDRVAWLPLADARRRLDYHSDTYAIDALQALEAGASRTTAVLLVRNGHAVPVEDWAGEDHDRPLSGRGEEQAAAAQRTLAAFMPLRLLAVPQERFIGTMRPLAAGLGLPVEGAEAFAEETYSVYPRHGLYQIQELARTMPMTAVCASGAVARHLISSLADDAGLAMEDVRAKKGSAWALFFSGGRLSAADYYPAFTSPHPVLTSPAADDDKPGISGTE